MKKQILLGYEIKTGKKVDVPLTHLVVTGITQESGKTTTLEALIKRSGIKAVVFKTKIGEKGFSEGTVIPPYFKERFDWEYVLDLLQSLRKEQMKFEKGWIIRLCKKADSLLSLSQNIKLILASDEQAKELFGKKLRDIDRNVLSILDAYLDKILPELQVSRFSNILELHDGVNIMDLERYTDEVASLIIKSVLDSVLKEFKNTIVVIPEAWKFIPQDSGNPCKGSVTSFIRQGATNGNYVWIDSQDITNTDKAPLKQISTWVLGYQSEINEIKRTLDQISLPKKKKPKPEDISQLPLGHFYATYKDFTRKVYVQPTWLDKKTAIKIAKGKLDVEKVKRPDKLVPFKIEAVPEKIEKLPRPSMIDLEKIKNVEKKVIELRTDTFDKFTQMQQMISNLSAELLKIKSMPKQEINLDEIVSIVLQKMPMQQTMPVNEEEIINKIMSRIPKLGMTTTYQVAPLEKLKKDFLEEAKDNLLSVISTLDDKQKIMLKWIEQKGTNSTKKDIFYNCFGKSATSGGTYTSLVKGLTDMKQKEIIKIDTHNRVYPYLKQRIEQLISQYGATEQEIMQVYNHILMEMLK